MKTDTIKAGAEKSRLIKNISVMSAVGLFAAAGIILFLYNIIKFNIVFCIVALIGTITGITVVIIKYNTVFARFVSADGENIYIRNWENGFFSYDILNETVIIREFIPAKTEMTSVPIKEIKRIILGTPVYLKRNNIGRRFGGMYNEVYAKAGAAERSELEKGDILYISTQKGASCFLPVGGLDRDAVADILIMLDKRGGIEIKCSDKEISSKIAAASGKDKRRKMEIIPQNLAAADILKSIKEDTKQKDKQ
ncbi:MAG: hypothetical protein J1F64_06665 [Oscillospiraceae bacterium]|nr:hypothetical protein [Oscillospiraceae bacterium]